MTTKQLQQKADRLKAKTAKLSAELKTARTELADVRGQMKAAKATAKK